MIDYAKIIGMIMDRHPAGLSRIRLLRGLVGPGSTYGQANMAITNALEAGDIVLDSDCFLRRSQVGDASPIDANLSVHAQARLTACYEMVLHNLGSLSLDQRSKLRATLNGDFRPAPIVPAAWEYETGTLRYPDGTTRSVTRSDFQGMPAAREYGID